MGAEPINTLEIVVQRKSGASWPIVVEYSRAGVLLPMRSEGVLEVGEETFQQLTSLLGQPRDYGNRLGQALFRESVRDAFVGALRESGDQLRVLLCIEADDLRLRWERLGAPIDGGWGVLALDQRTPFSLYIPSTTDRRFPPIGRRDLRALLLVASPNDSNRYQLAPFDAQATVESLKAALGDIPCDVLANVAGAIGSPSLDELCARLTDRIGQYTLLHVVCHGKLLDGGETALYWANADNQIQPVTATDLLNRLLTVRGPRGLPHFAFLSACESAGAGAEGALGGLAQRLVRELGMPAVLAMTEKVTMKTAAALAEAFYRQLGQSGEVDTALPEATAALAKRGDILVPALFSRLGGRPLFSDQLDRELTNAEIRFGLDRIPALFDERAPVLKEDIAAQSAISANTLGADATALSRDDREERRQALEKVNTLSQEALDLSFNALALGQQPPAYDARCPFRGLYPFGPEEREFFFGRETLIEALRQKLAEQNFLPILGPSGSGKSSLVFAGLIPALQGQEKGLRVADFTPGSEPLKHLEAAVATLSDQPGVLVVDQFEEVFTLCADEGNRLAFIERMLVIAGSRRVVLTMRADFWGECAPYTNLKERMEARQSLIAPMDAAELRKAMEMQAAKVGLRFEAGLGSRVLDEVHGEPGAMPLLQHALLELWKRRHGRWLRADEYEAIGGVQRAISRTADEVYDSLSPKEQQQVRNIFVRLTRLDASAVQGRDTRRRMRIEDLVPAGADPAVIEQLVQRLAGQEARLVVTSVDGTTQRVEVEVAHEALIRHWPRLQRWLDEDRANLLIREAIRQAAEEWEQHGQEESYLIHRGGRLADVEALSKRPDFLNTDEIAYVRACAELRERQERGKEEQSQRELQAAKQIAEEQKARAEQETKARKSAQTKTRVAFFASAAVLAAAIFAGVKWRQAEISHIDELIAAAQVQFSLNHQLDGLMSIVSASRTLAQPLFQAWWPKDLQSTVEETMWNLLLGATERNRFSASEPIAGVVFAPDDRTIATWTDRRGKLQLWKPDGTSSDPPWLKNTEGVSHVAFSGDGNNRGGKIAIAYGNVVAFRKLVDDGSWTELSVDKGRVNAIALSAGGKMIAAATTDENNVGHVQLWDVDDHSLSRLLEGNGMGRQMAVAFSPDGKQLAVTGENGAFLWKTDGTESRKLEGLRSVNDGHAGSVNAVAFSPDGTMIATGSDDKTVKIWNTDGTLLKTLCCHTGKVRGLGFRPDSQVVASASNDRTVKLWTTGAEGTLLRTLSGHSGMVRAVAFSHDGRTLASASDDETVKLWESAGSARKALLHDDTVYAAAFSPDGRIVLTTSGDGWLTFWNADGRDLRILKKQRWQYGPITAIAFSGDGKMVATASADRSVKLGTIDSGTLGDRGFLEGQTGEPTQTEVIALSFSPDGKSIAAGGVSKKVQVWNTKDKTLRRPEPLFTTEDRITGIDFSADGENIVVGDDSGAVQIIRSKDGTLLRNLQEKGKSITGVRYSLADGTIAAAGADSTVKLWKADGTLVKTLSGHKGPVQDVAFSPDGKVIATAGSDKTVKLWSADGMLVKTLRGHEGAIRHVSFSPDGKTVASASEDQTVILWTWQEDRKLEYACDWMRDYLTNSSKLAEDDRHLCDGVQPLQEQPPAALVAPPTTQAGAGVSPAPVVGNAAPSIATAPIRIPEMVSVPAGHFEMGSPQGDSAAEATEKPQHTVTIAKPFAVSRDEITFDEWDACVADGGCNDYRPDDEGWDRSGHPVVNVSWKEARAYARWLSAKTGKSYRLLTEAEWEYAARSGATTRYWWGNDIGAGNANCTTCGSQWDGRSTAPTGSFNPNLFGLSDMNGNVWEWVQDCWHPDYRRAPADGTAWEAGPRCSGRILRGGSWDNSAAAIRSAQRIVGPPDARANNVGFRIARDE